MSKDPINNKNGEQGEPIDKAEVKTPQIEPSEKDDIAGAPITSNTENKKPENYLRNGAFFIRRRNRYVLGITVVVLSIAMFIIVGRFLVPLIVAAFSTLIYPFYLRIGKITKNKKNISSLLCCIILLFGVLLPIYLVGYSILHETMEMYNTSIPKLRKLASDYNTGIGERIKHSKLMALLKLEGIDWKTAIQESIRTSAKLVTTLINKTSSGILELVVNLFIVLFCVFYFLRDGEMIVQRLKYLSPLPSEQEEEIISKFLLISRATVMGTVIIGLVQGFLGAITLMIFGIKSWAIWGMVMVVLSVIPLVGQWVVMVPAGIIQIFLGYRWRGLAIICISVIVISSLDNFIRPKLVGGQARMHDLLIFFSTLGGIAVFGPMGFIVGPVIAALFVAIIDIYGREFKEFLNEADSV